MTNADRDLAELPVQFPCPECKGMIQRTLYYLREYRILWCEHCGQPVTYNGSFVQQVEELVRSQSPKQ